MPQNSTPAKRAILVLYDYAARDACALIVGFQTDIYLCNRTEIMRRLDRTHGQSTLFREALQQMDETLAFAQDIERQIVAENRRIRGRGGPRAKGPQITPYPRDYARDIAFAGVIAGDGKIFGSSSFEMNGQAAHIPDRSFRRSDISVPPFDRLILSAQQGFEFHRHGLQAHFTLARRFEQRAADTQLKS